MIVGGHSSGPNNGFCDISTFSPMTSQHSPSFQETYSCPPGNLCGNMHRRVYDKYNILHPVVHSMSQYLFHRGLQFAWSLSTSDWISDMLHTIGQGTFFFIVTVYSFKKSELTQLRVIKGIFKEVNITPLPLKINVIV